MPVIKREVCETTVDPYLPNIAMILEEAHKLNVHVPTASIYQDIQKLGYRGSLRWMHPKGIKRMLNLGSKYLIKYLNTGV